MADEGGSTENTSITSAQCHKAVKQNQSHIELPGFQWAHWGTHMHPQQDQWNQHMTSASATDHKSSSVMLIFKSFHLIYILNSHVVDVLPPYATFDEECLLSFFLCANSLQLQYCKCSWEPEIESPRAPKPKLLPGQLQPPAVKSRKQSKHAPS